MPTIVNCPQVREIGECPIGSLVMASGTHPTWLLVLTSGDNVTVAVLEGIDQEPAYEKQFYPDVWAASTDVVDFGTEWVLELLPDGQLPPGHTKGIEGDRPIVLLGDGPAIRLAKRGQIGPATVSLSTFKPIGQDHYYGAPCMKWRIWASKEAYGDLRAIPLLYHAAR